jgi:queuine tRNA-ribosyltransferase
VRVDDDGITVSSHVDGTAVRFTPRSWMVLQEQLGADLNVALHPPASRGRSSTIADRSISWAERCIAARTHVRQGLLAAVPDLPEETESRSISLHLAGLPFDGFVVGPDPGAEPRHDLAGQLGRVVPFLPGHLPRHAGGVYGPRDVFAAVRAGIDTFDCLEPLRLARHGFLFTSAGPISIREPRFRVDFGPPDDDCACTTCERFSSAYLHHLFACEELLAYRLATVHNLALLSRLTARIRSCIREGGRLSELEREMLPETT